MTLLGSPLRGKKRLDLLNSQKKILRDFKNTRDWNLNESARLLKDVDENKKRSKLKLDERRTADQLYSRAILAWGEYRVKYPFQNGQKLTKTEFLRYWIWWNRNVLSPAIDEECIQNYFESNRENMRDIMKRANNKIVHCLWNQNFTWKWTLPRKY